MHSVLSNCAGLPQRLCAPSPISQGSRKWARDCFCYAGMMLTAIQSGSARKTQKQVMVGRTVPIEGELTELNERRRAARQVRKPDLPITLSVSGYSIAAGTRSETFARVC